MRLRIRRGSGGSRWWWTTRLARMGRLRLRFASTVLLEVHPELGRAGLRWRSSIGVPGGLTEVGWRRRNCGTNDGARLSAACLGLRHVGAVRPPHLTVWLQAEAWPLGRGSRPAPPFPLELFPPSLPSNETGTARCNSHMPRHSCQASADQRQRRCAYPSNEGGSRWRGVAGSGASLRSRLGVPLFPDLVALHGVVARGSYLSASCSRAP